MKNQSRNDLKRLHNLLQPRRGWARKGLWKGFGGTVRKYVFGFASVTPFPGQCSW